MSLSSVLGSSAREVFIPTNGIRLHCIDAGSEDGPLVIFLHGYPEFWYSWRHQIRYFAERGFRVLAPDQRGYNLSDKPRGLSAYRLDVLAADVIGLLDHLRREKAFVVGHDWGGVVAWWLGMQYPDRLHKLAILNVPHPTVMRQHLRRNPEQRRRSRYVFFFQLPWLPERSMRKNNWEMARKALLKTSLPGTFTEEDIQQYVQAWSQPGAATAMINWYRAALRRKPRPRRDSIRVPIPTLLIWGAQDRFLGQEMVQPSIELCDNGQVERIDEATHWVQQDMPDKVNRLLEAFFAGKR